MRARAVALVLRLASTRFSPEATASSHAGEAKLMVGRAAMAASSSAARPLRAKRFAQESASQQLTLVHAKNDDVRGLSNPPSALLTSLRLTVPRVLHLSLGSREKNRVVNFEAHALRRHEHAAFADQRLEPPQLSQTLSASPRAAATDRAASTVPETHGSAGSHAELSPAVGPAPDSRWPMPSTAILSSAWHRMRKRPPEELAGSGRSTRARRS